jgi:site-specific DNA-methyltransferase (adenine-specific)
MGKDWDNATILGGDTDTKETSRRLQQRTGFISFMEKVLRESFRVLKPGGHAVVWALPRTSHWTAMALENAGFEIRDCIYHVKPRSLEIEAFLASLSPEQNELLQRCSPTDEFLLHLFGSGFPKSLSVGKALDKMAGAVREVVGTSNTVLGPSMARSRSSQLAVEGNNWQEANQVTAPSTEEAKLWEGWGTALKPAVEVWWICRKPLEESTVANQVKKTGTGAMNIDGCRVYTDWNEPDRPESWKRSGHAAQDAEVKTWLPVGNGVPCHPSGRWPSNLVLSHAPGCVRAGTRDVPANKEGAGRLWSHYRDDKLDEAVPTQARLADANGNETVANWECSPECPVRMLDEQNGTTTSGAMKVEVEAYDGDSATVFLRGRSGPSNQHGDSGGVSRFFKTFEHDPPFFYVAKAARSEREAGLTSEARAMHSIEDSKISTQSNRRCTLCHRVKFGQPHCVCANPEWEETAGSLSKNTHPTVKSLKLMRYLIRLVTPKGGIVLDPFSGSGSTLVAALQEGMSFVGIEREAEYTRISSERVRFVAAEELAQRRDRETFNLLAELDQEF